MDTKFWGSQNDLFFTQLPRDSDYFLASQNLRFRWSKVWNFFCPLSWIKRSKKSSFWHFDKNSWKNEIILMDLAGTDDRKWKSRLSSVEIMPTFVSKMGFSLFRKKTFSRLNSQLLFRRFEQISAHFRAFKKLKSSISEKDDYFFTKVCVIWIWSKK